MKTIYIKDNYIKMNQLIKLCGFVSQGSDVKELIDNKKITLNNNIVTELRKKVYLGDIVSIKDIGEIKVEEKKL